MSTSRSCVISLIGRPNVGKSTIFNRIMRQSYRAMTHNQPGVTRDRHYGIAQVEDERGENEQDIILVDTGGFYPDKVEATDVLGKKKTAEPFFNIMAEHAKLAISESDLVLMIVDVREGLLPFDKTIYDYIRTTKKPVWVIVNKFDSDAQWGEEADFYELGMHEDSFFIVSAEHGRGLTTLKESIHTFNKNFKKGLDDYDIQMQLGVTPRNDVVAKVAMIGAPNAGKSTLLNQFIGAKRALVSDIAGTTVDPIEGYFDLKFGSKVKYLIAQDDQFRKSNRELGQEWVEFAEENTEAELIAYDQMPEEYKTGDGYIDLSTIDFGSDDDEDSEELFSAEDNIQDLEGPEETIEAQVEELAEVDEDAEKLEASAPSETDFNPFRSVKLVDTAGIRKQKNVEGFIEEQSVYRSLRAISEADVILYVVDATQGITHQDRRLMDIALEKGKSIIICLNKVDLLKEVMTDSKRKQEWIADLRDSIPWLSFCQLITISALKGSYINSLKNALKRTIIVRNMKVKTGHLNKAVTHLVDRNPIVLTKEKGAARFKVKYASMLKATPPTFLLFTNKSKGIPPNYRQYLTNGLRREFDMVNTPVHLIFRTTTDIEKRMRME